MYFINLSIKNRRGYTHPYIHINNDIPGLSLYASVASTLITAV